MRDMTAKEKYNAVHFGVKVTISNENLVRLKHPTDIDFGLKQAKGIDRIILEQIGPEKFKLIADLTDSYGLITNEAQKFLAQNASSIPQITAFAIIVNNLPIRILVKFYLRFFKPLYPTKIFPNIAVAQLWLDKFNEDVYDSNAG